MEIKFGEQIVTVKNEQAISCFHALKVTLDAEESSTDHTLNKLWLDMNSALVNICDHYADKLREENGIPSGTDWDFIE